MKIGVIREGKNPPDKRVPLTPEQCKQFNEKFDAELVVQPSPIRAFKDEEYANLGVTLQEDLSDCDVIIGVKEVPIDMLIDNKQFFFFSHTIKKQPYNAKLMKSFLDKGITMTDYETLTYPNGARILGFGRYAGLVGAYNGILAWGKRTGDFDLKAAHATEGLKEMFEELKKVKFGNKKIAITGNGRVAKGAMEILDELKIKKVSPEDYLTQSYDEVVYTQLLSQDFYTSKEGKDWSSKDFYANPKEYKSTFLRYTSMTDLFISCHYWDHNADVLWTAEDMRSDDFNIKVVADITCDIKGSIPSTIQPSTIADPIYGYNPKTEDLGDAFAEENITVMAVDNLPCEVPKDASEGFGTDMIDKVLPCLIESDPDTVIERASITVKGKLGEGYQYLSDYAGL